MELTAPAATPTTVARPIIFKGGAQPSVTIRLTFVVLLQLSTETWLFGLMFHLISVIVWCSHAQATRLAPLRQHQRHLNRFLLYAMTAASFVLITIRKRVRTVQAMEQCSARSTKTAPVVLLAMPALQLRHHLRPRHQL
jgi:hypothetical protein